MLRLIVMAIATLAALPVAAAQTRPPSFVDAATAVPNLVVDMRYLGSDNFIGRPIDGYEKPICYLTRRGRGSARRGGARSRAAGLGDQGVRLLPAGAGGGAFSCAGRATCAIEAHKAKYYPQVDKRHLFRDGYIAARSGHSRGSTIDMTLVRRARRQGARHGHAVRLLQPALGAVGQDA